MDGVRFRVRCVIISAVLVAEYNDTLGFLAFDTIDPVQWRET